MDEVKIFDSALSTVAVQAIYRSSEPTLVLGFDERHAAKGATLTDSSGWQNNGVIESGAGDTANKLVPGKHDTTALWLDGTDDMVTLPATAALGLTGGDFTVAAWINASALNGKRAVLGTDTAVQNQGLQLSLEEGAAAMHFFNNDIRGTRQLTANTWYHIVWRYSGATGEQAVFVDGQLDKAEAGHAPFVGTGFVRIGQALGAQQFAGMIDDLRIFPQALGASEIATLALSGWRDTSLTARGNTVSQTEWSANLPQGLEGFYRVDLRGRDTLDNIATTGQSRNVWSGTLDTLAPRSTLLAEQIGRGSMLRTRYTLTAEDYNLSDQNLDIPSGCKPVVTSREFYGSAWYRTHAGAAAPARLFKLTATCEIAGVQANTQARVCDHGGNCATAPATIRQVPLPIDVLIRQPTSGVLLTTNDQVTISGAAYAEGGLKQLQVRIGTTILSTKDWAQGETNEADWNVVWQPTEGEQEVVATLTSWNDVIATSPPVQVIVNTKPLELIIATSVITSTNLQANGLVALNGTVIEGASAQEVIVGVDGEPTQPATITGNTWMAAWVPSLENLLDGRSVTITAQAKSKSGRTTAASQVVLVDLVPPTFSSISALDTMFVDGSAPVLRGRTTDGAGIRSVAVEGRRPDTSTASLK